MLKLPVCPYCGAIYRYKDISSMPAEKRHMCYHCKREFGVSRKKGKIILVFSVCIILIIFNLIALYNFKGINFPIMVIANFLCVLIAFILFPFTTRFYPIKLTKSEKRRLKEISR